MKYEIVCPKCGHISSSILDFKCPCGSPLEMYLPLNFEKKSVHKQSYSLWRYASFFPYVNQEEIISLGEGWTPLVKFSDSLYFKLDYLNPTGSFKDRGSAVLISALHKPVKKAKGYISEDSSGNAGASMAAYAARAGLKAKIYVPETVSGQKFNQTLLYGAEVVKVSGSRSMVTEEALKPNDGKFYVGHVLHPLFRDGIRSLAYELIEQFNWNLFEAVYLPVSAGTLLLGVISGLVHLRDSGIVDAVPRIIACQTRQVSPLYHKFKGLRYNPPESVSSIADALRSVNPPLLELMVEKLKDVDGDAVVVEENEIIDAYTSLARSGFLVEPSSAVAYAAYKKQLQNGKIHTDTKTVIVLTGIGLKTSLNFTK
jgi:threonine synthase